LPSKPSSSGKLRLAFVVWTNCTASDFGCTRRFRERIHDDPKPVREGFGQDRPGQIAKLLSVAEEDGWATIAKITTVAPDGKRREKIISSADVDGRPSIQKILMERSDGYPRAQAVICARLSSSAELTRLKTTAPSLSC
jgi:hypothetical protein